MAFLPALIGAGGGLLGSLLPRLFDKKESRGSYLTKPEQIKQFERFTPEQQQLQKFLSSALTGQGPMPQGGILGQLFSPEGFEAYAAPARREFFESTVPGLAERFSSLGAGAQKSSAFQQQLAEAGKRLSTELGEMRGRQQQGLLGTLLGQVMQPQFDRIYQPEAPTGLAKGLGFVGGEATRAFMPLIAQLLAKAVTGGV